MAVWRSGPRSRFGSGVPCRWPSGSPASCIPASQGSRSGGGSQHWLTLHVVQQHVLEEDDGVVAAAGEWGGQTAHVSNKPSCNCKLREHLTLQRSNMAEQCMHGPEQPVLVHLLACGWQT